jgi:hypothetical protein
MASAPPPPPPGAPKWYVLSNGAAQGPYEQSHVLAWLTAGQMPYETQVCPVGAQSWQPASHWQVFAPLSHASGFEAFSPQSFNPYVSPSTSRSARGPVPGMRLLAIWHRTFTISVLILGFSFAALSTLPLPPIFGWLFFIECWLSQIVVSGGLAYAIGSTGGWVCVGFSLIPYLGLIPFFILSRIATKKLQKNGVKVGLFGPRIIPRA